MIRADGSIGFELPDGYDPGAPLTLDPILVYSTHLGGMASDGGNGIALDGLGYPFITGDSLSTNFSNAYPRQASLAGASSLARPAAMATNPAA